MTKDKVTKTFCITDDVDKNMPANYGKRRAQNSINIPILLHFQLVNGTYLLPHPVHFPEFLLFLRFPSFYLPQSPLRRICFVTPSNKGTQKRRKNEQGTKEERTKWVPEGGNDVAQTRVRKRMRIKKYFTRYTLFDYVIKIYNLYL